METYLAQTRLHHLWPVVDGEDNIRDAGIGEGLDLVEDHGPVAELDQRLGEGQGLPSPPSVSTSFVAVGGSGHVEFAVGGSTYERSEAGAEAAHKN